MHPYRLFAHDGLGNFNLLQEFSAQNDAAAAKFVGRWNNRPLELWQSSRRVKCWS
jgi:hypothetical protein